MVIPEGNDISKALYKGLKALSESTFPKKCGMCGRVYNNSGEFIAESGSVISGSGLKESIGDDKKPVVELFRNCVCGSTLMEFFSDRRDLSEAGIKRREAFANIQKILKGKGLSATDARRELLNVMHGNRSQWLEDLGIRIR